MSYCGNTGNRMFIEETNTDTFINDTQYEVFFLNYLERSFIQL